MNLLTQKELLRNLLFSSDLLNTMNGGTAMTYVNAEETPQEIIIRVSAPSVPAEAFQVIVEAKRLVICSLLERPLAGENRKLAMPMFSHEFPIPAHADPDQAEAIYENGQLKITLPLRPSERRTQRHIQIRQV